MGYAVLLMWGGVGAPLHATHIAGAELTYECINPATHTYRIRLIMYRDCLNANPGAVFDNPIDLFIFPTGQSTGDTVIQLSTPSIVQLTLPNLGACVATPPNICIERGEYTAIVRLPPRPLGYDLGWQRCCRNNIILNLVNPLQRGMTWTTHVPGTLEVNVPNNGSSFRNVLPYFLCAGEELVFDHSAIDLDGDSLAYKLVAAYDGINFLGQGAGNGAVGANPPIVNQGGNLMGRPPYVACNYNPGYSALQPFSTLNGGFTTLNARTGQLRLRPGNPGTYVLAVEVEEYRNGVLIARNRRDIQLTVVVCLNFGSPPSITRNFQGARFSGSNLFFSPDSGQCFRFLISDPDVNRQMQARVNYVITGGTNPLPSFSSTGTNPVNVTVCWTPTCAQSATRLRLDLVAEDINGCSNYNSAYDTVYLNVAPVVQSQPVVQFSAPGRTLVRDTIVNIEPDTLVCFEYLARDLRQLGRPTHQLIQTQNFGVPATTTLLAQTDSSVRVRVCWRPNCAALNGTATFVASSTRQECPPAPITYDTIHVRVRLPVDAPPTLQLEPNLGTRVNGVLQLTLDQGFCLPFVLRDANPRLNAGTSTFQSAISLVGGGTYNGPSPTINIISRTDTAVRGTVCFPTQCAIANTRLRLRLTGNQPNKCRPNHVVRDSVDFIIRVPPNPRPRLSKVLPAGLTMQGNTVILTPDGSLCYEVQYRDSLPVGSRAFRVSAFRVGGGSAPLPSFTVLSQSDTLTRLRLCYAAGCALRGAPIGLVLEADDSLQCVLMHRVRDTLLLQIRDLPNPPPTLQFGFPTPPMVTQGDTLVLTVDSTFCFNTLGQDLATPSFTLRTRFLRLINAQGQTQTAFVPTSSRMGTTPTLITDRWCFTPRCSLLNRTLGLVYELTDSSLCQMDHRIRDTLWVRIRQLPNPPPSLNILTQPGILAQNDTLLIVADSTVCYRTVGRDTGLLKFRLSKRYAGAITPSGQPWLTNVPTPTPVQMSDSLLLTDWCWRAPCDQIGQTLGLVYELADSNTCTLDHLRRDTLWLRIIRPRLNPPTLTWTTSLPRVGDTVLYDVNQPGSLQLTLEDLAQQGALQLNVDGAPTPLADSLATGILNTTWTWRPLCPSLDTTLRLVFTGSSSPPCADTTLFVTDTVYLRVVEPVNNAPSIARDIGFDNTRTPGDTLCYTLTVTDPDVNPLLVVEGESTSFNAAFGVGSPARFTVQGSNPLLVRVCIVPNCYQQEESFFVTVCVTDTSTCTERFVVCDSIRLSVGICHLRMPNVFTPNGDGVNETFGPYDDQGIEEYTLSVFDRWGRQLYGPTVNGRWNGTWNNAAAPDGTYFYRIHYRLFSGQASPLGSDQTGQVTILR